MPRAELFRIAILTGACSRNAAVISSLVIWKLPSPSISHTGFLSSKKRCAPIEAPMAAGRPKPIVPRPEEDSHECAFSKFRNCEAHIWCWPTSVTQMVDGSAYLPSCCTTHCGASVPSVGSSYVIGYLLRQRSIAAHHGFKSGLPCSACSFSICGIRSSSTVATSPTIGTSATRFLPISAGSISMWMTRAVGANASSLPVTRSSKRAPMATSRSERWMAPVAAMVPCMPGMPRFCGCESGMMPRAGSVVTTGAPVTSASFSTCLRASERTAPPPTYSTGRYERSNRRAASVRTRPCAFMVGL